MALNPESIALVGAIFLLAGLIKGVVGLGLPTVSLALLTVTVGLKAGIALMLVPSFATNVWQAVVGGRGRALMARLWTMLLAVVIGLWFGTGVLARSDAVILSAIFGGLLMLWSAYGLLLPRMPQPGTRERLLSPIFGAVTRLHHGADGLVHVRACCISVPWAGTRCTRPGDGDLLHRVDRGVGPRHVGKGAAALELGLLSVAGLPTAFAGMWLGKKARPSGRGNVSPGLLRRPLRVGGVRSRRLSFSRLFVG